MQANNKCPFGEKLQKYWDRRYFLFSRFDEGILIDEEGLYSVKPEKSALKIGEIIPGDIVLDAFCGIGGSAIGLARAGKKVITVDIDKDRIDMARHNAEIYGVQNRIIFHHDDCMNLIKSTKFDSIYLDPPWQGPGYSKLEKFPLNAFEPDGKKLLKLVFSKTKYVVFTVPMNFDLFEVIPFYRNFQVMFDWDDNNLDTKRPIFQNLIFS